MAQPPFSKHSSNCYLVISLFRSFSYEINYISAEAFSILISARRCLVKEKNFDNGILELPLRLSVEGVTLTKAIHIYVF